MSRFSSAIVTSVTTPVDAVRMFATAIVPNGVGGWKFIGYMYNTGSSLAPEFAIVNLDDGTYTITDGVIVGTHGAYSQRYQISTQPTTGVTCTANAGTDVVTRVNHGMLTGTPCRFGNTGGALPAPLSATAVYFAIYLTADTFKLATNYDNAVAGTAIDLTTNGTGTNTLYAVTQVPLRDKNGRTWFPCLGLYLAYYDEADGLIHQVSQIVDPVVTPFYNTFPFKNSWGPDGNIYGGTQVPASRDHFNVVTPRCPLLTKIDVDARTYTAIGRVGTFGTPTGRDADVVSYGYYVAADTNCATPRAYVAVGQNPWELSSVVLATGVQTIIATRPAGAVMSFLYKPEGLVVSMTLPTEKLWIVDGVTYPYSDGYDPLTLPFTPRCVTPRLSPVAAPPEVDLTPGSGIVRWRPFLSTDEFTDTVYLPRNAASVEIEDMTALADGTLLGQVEQYLGFFRYDRVTDTATVYGPWSAGMSRGAKLMHSNGYLYMAGYPNSGLWRFDPAASWSLVTPKNPLKLGNFTDSTATLLSGCKYVHNLLESANGKIFMCGLRERSGTGGGVGSYDIAGTTFAGTSTNLQYLNPRGLVLIDSLDTLIFSGELNGVAGSPASAQLVKFDRSLTETARLTVLDGMVSTGAIFPTSNPQVICGISSTSGLAYRINHVTGVVLQTTALTTYGTVGESTQNASGLILVQIGDYLYSVSPENLAVTLLSTLTEIVGAGSILQIGRQAYVSVGATLYELTRTAHSKRFSLGKGVRYA